MTAKKCPDCGHAMSLKTYRHERSTYDSVDGDAGYHRVQVWQCPSCKTIALSEE